MNKLAKSGEALAAGDLPAVAATVGCVPLARRCLMYQEQLHMVTTWWKRQASFERHGKAVRVCRSDAWVGEFQRASTGLSTNDEAKKSANAIFQVCSGYDKPNK